MVHGDSLSGATGALEVAAQDWTEHAAHELMQKRHGTFMRNLRYRVMIMYRRLFNLVFCANFAVSLFLSIGEKPSLASLASLANASIGNLLAAGLIRNDHVVNVLFHLFASMPNTWPLTIRRLGAKIYHFGGLHSGCAIFAIAWHHWLTSPSPEVPPQNPQLFVYPHPILL
jgi:hypothetical protein